MKVFSILKLASFPDPRPQEDYFCISKKYPIFIVADGVSLQTKDGESYPKQSGAGMVARVFCELAMKEAEKRYETFTKEDLKDIFELSNKAVLEYNISCGITKNTVNYWDEDFFSATVAFLLIKEKKVYWFSLCDSGLVVFNSKVEKIFNSPDGWAIFKKHSPKNWENMQEKEKMRMLREEMLRKKYRNVVSEKGELVGYGVADGEESAKLYLNTGMLNMNTGDLLFLHTDGFENYFSIKEFINIFKLWPKDIKSKLEGLISEKSEEDLSKYGLEKTLIAIYADK
ncbi:MAG: protein phosphatase 2C domain-containing protein [Candidatus Staskawiczbacteria bacterium]|nr:protein phosphatase 2C domain-containing protein [Candidatus Staskawiczbacteria bacterium]